MGSAKRMRPSRLGEKVFLIRKKLGYSLSEMARVLSADVVVLRKQDISRFEKGSREPNLITVLGYSRLVDIQMEVLVDDQLDLPKDF
jgi:transcriptional regulator with XRE-family HTH domain